MTGSMLPAVPASLEQLAGTDPDFVDTEFEVLDTDAMKTPESPFVLRTGGVYYLGKADDNGCNGTWVCSYLNVLALTRNAIDQEWGRLVEVIDPSGIAHRWVMPMSMTAGNGVAYREYLLSLGLHMAAGWDAKDQLHEYLMASRPSALVLCVPRIGWHGHQFVLPGEVYGNVGDEDIILQESAANNQFGLGGDLAQWQEHVGRPCQGNSRLVLAVSAALAGPLLEPLNGESGGYHLRGKSSLGKTTALLTAGSVSGGGGIRGNVRTWRTTDNGVEVVAARHCDTLLCLDEINEVDGKAAGAIAYMLANGIGKARAKRDGSERTPLEWRLVFLSSGEISLADKIHESAGRKTMAGQSVRMVDIPADAGAGLGLFENLHGHESADHFARKLKDASASYYGTPLRAFLQKFVADRDDLTKLAREIMDGFEVANCPDGADGQISRVCGRFALVAAAGELGIMLGVLPWPVGEASNAIATCFNAWLAQRGDIGVAEIAAGLEKVRGFFQANGVSRFQDMDMKKPQPVGELAGYRRLKDGKPEFLVFPAVFRQEVCAGLNEDMIYGELKRAGILLSEGTHNTRNVRIPGKQKRMIVLTHAILGGSCGSCGKNAENTEEISLHDVGAAV